MLAHKAPGNCLLTCWHKKRKVNANSQGGIVDLIVDLFDVVGNVVRLVKSELGDCSIKVEFGPAGATLFIPNPASDLPSEPVVLASPESFPASDPSAIPAQVLGLAPPRVFTPEEVESEVRRVLGLAERSNGPQSRITVDFPAGFTLGLVKREILPRVQAAGFWLAYDKFGGRGPTLRVRPTAQGAIRVFVWRTGRESGHRRPRSPSASRPTDDARDAMGVPHIDFSAAPTALNLDAAGSNGRESPAEHLPLAERQEDAVPELNGGGPPQSGELFVPAYPSSHSATQSDRNSVEETLETRIAPEHSARAEAGGNRLQPAPEPTQAHTAIPDIVVEKHSSSRDLAVASFTGREAIWEKLRDPVDDDGRGYRNRFGKNGKKGNPKKLPKRDRARH